ncbi:MAG TPA: FeoA family protein [Longimicrobiales bacterium]
MITAQDTTTAGLAADEAMAGRGRGAADAVRGELRLGEVPLRRVVELTRIDLPTEEMVPLLERGIVPGCQLCPVRRSPTGDPILLVDGTLIAMRREMAGCLCVREAGQASN